MRDAFARTITELGREDPRLVFLSGDIGNRMFDRFKADQPERFYNCGVAEANMISVAAGLAMTGYSPWVYTIASFLTYRPFEQIRVDVAYHHLPVILVGTGAGLCYASNGPTHHSVEDIALYRALPGMNIACPGDAFEVVSCTRELQRVGGPAYLRLGKKGEPKVHAAPPGCTIGKAIEMRPGRHAAFLTTGNMLHDALAACDMLKQRGLEIALWHFPWVQPIDTAAFAAAFSQFPLVASVEEHSIDGGFGSLAAEWRACQSGTGGRLLRLGVPRRFIHETTEQDHAREMCGLHPAGLAAQIEAALSGKSAPVPAPTHAHG